MHLTLPEWSRWAHCRMCGAEAAHAFIVVYDLNLDQARVYLCNGHARAAFDALGLEDGGDRLRRKEAAR